MSPRKYHVVLADGSERDITAEDARVEQSGALVFFNSRSDASIIYAPGSWVLCELETRDDRS